MHVSELEILKPLAGGAGEASVTLVRGGGRLMVLKRHRPSEIAAERLFQQTLARHGLPCLGIEACDGLGPDRLLLEYVADSPTLGGNPMPDLCRRWGAAVRAMHDMETGLTVRSEANSAAWRANLSTRINHALSLQRQRGLLAPETIARAEAALADLEGFEPARQVFTHGDLHVNNALTREDRIVLFDKPASLWAAPAIFDLALIFSEGFPGARYGADRPGDPERMAAFLEGYGGVPADELEWLDHMVLLRSLRRFPNLFAPELGLVIERALERASAVREPRTDRRIS